MRSWYIITHWRELRRQYRLYSEAVMIQAKIIYKKRNPKAVKEQLVRRFLEQNDLTFWQWLKSVEAYER